MRIQVAQKSSDLESWLNQLQKKISELKPDNEEVQAKLKELQISLEQAIKNQAKQQQSQVNCQKQIALLRSQIESASDSEKARALEEKIKEMDTELGKMKNQASVSEISVQLKGLQEEFLNFKKSSEQTAKFSSALRVQLQGVIEESGRQAEQFANWQNEFTNKYSQQAEAQEEAITELQTQLSQTKTALNKRLAALEGRVSQAESKIINLDEKMTVTQPEFTVVTKLQLLRKMVLNDELITHELAYYIAPNGQPDPISTDHSPLYEWMEKEFLQSEARVLLLQGQAGAGKSTFNRHVLRQLWQDKAWDSFKPGDSIPKMYVPIFIPLGSTQVDPKKFFDYFRDLPELVDDFTDAEINVLKRDYCLLLIADGYDEMPGQRAVNLYDANQLHQYEGRVKLLIGCRTQRSQEISEKEFFVPHDRSGNAQFAFYRGRHVSPFNEKQIAGYIEKYLEKNKDQSDLNLWADVATYQQYFERLSDLKKLIDTPFLLLITVQVLPQIVAEVEREAKSSSTETNETRALSHINLTRSKLYDSFMGQWFARQIKKEREAGTLPERGELEKDYKQFCKKLAACFHSANIAAVQFPFEQEELFAESRVKAENPEGPKGAWVKLLFGSDDQRIVQARRGSPLRTASGNYHQFVHASLIDYFLATAVWQHSVDPVLKPVVKQEEVKLTDSISIESKDPIKEDGAVKPKEADSARKKDITVLDSDIQALTVKSEDVLAQGLLSFDQRNFLADRVQQDEAFKHYLFSLIERSKKEEGIADIAANAITILNTARVSFSGMNFNGIRIPGADLSYAVMDSAQLQNADLTKVTFVGAWLNQADFTNSCMENTEWGECPYFTLPEGMADSVFSGTTVYSNDGRWVARSFDSLGRGKTGERPGIYLYDTATYQLQRIIKEYTYHAYRNKVKKYNLVLTGISMTEGTLSLSTVWDLGLDSDMAAYIRVKNQLYFATTSYDGECKLIDVTEKQLSDFDEAMKTNSLTFNKPRELSDQELWKMEAITGHLPWQVCTRKVDYPENIAFDGRSKYLVSNFSTSIAFWDVKTGKSLFSIELPDYLQSNIAIDIRGKRLACCTGFGSSYQLNLWRIPSGKIIRSFEGIKSKVRGIAFDPQGLYLATDVGDTHQNISVGLWEIKTGKLSYTLTAEEGWSLDCSIAFSPKGEYLSYFAGKKRSSHRPESAYIWHLETKKLHWSGKTTCEIVFDHQDEYFATSDGSRVNLWNAANGKLEKTFEGHKDQISNIFFDRNCEYLISESLDKTIRKWRLSAFSSQSNMKNNACLTMGVAVSSNGEYLASSSDKAVFLWKTTTGKLECKLEGHEDNVEDFTFHPSGKMLFAAAGKLIYLWDLTARKLETTMLFDQSQDLPDIKKIKPDWQFKRIKKLAIHPSEDLLASLIEFTTKRVIDYAGRDKCMIWNLKTRKIERVLNENRDYSTKANHFVFHPSGKYLEYSTSAWFFNERPKYDWQYDELTYLLASVKHSYRYHCFDDCFEFSPKTEWAALGGQGSDLTFPPVTLWNISTQTERQLAGHTDTINTVAFDPSGELLASGSDDLTARIWQVATGACLAVIEGLMGPVKKFAWSQNTQGLFLAASTGDRVVLGGGEKALRVWRVDPNADKSSLTVMLCWTTYQAALTALNTNMNKVRGLQQSDMQLLQQRGARFDFIQTKHEDSKDKKDTDTALSARCFS